MNNEVEDEQHTSIGNGLYKVPNAATPIDDKVARLFTKLKRRAREADESASLSSNPSPGQPVQNIEPNLNELGQSAMNSYRLRSEVVKTEGGFEVV